MSNVYKAIIRISKEESKEINGYIDNPKNEEDCLGEDQTITHTAKFPNGYFMDIKCCGVRFDEELEDNSAWTEAVLFDNNGKQVTYSEPGYEYEGEWELIDFEHNDIYQVDVIVQKDKNKKNKKKKNKNKENKKPTILKIPNSYYILSCTINREIQEPQVFLFASEAYCAMRNEFCKTLGLTLEEYNSIYNDMESTTTAPYESEIMFRYAWINNCQHKNYNWKIYEITLS